MHRREARTSGARLRPSGTGTRGGSWERWSLDSSEVCRRISCQWHRSRGSEDERGKAPPTSRQVSHAASTQPLGAHSMPARSWVSMSKCCHGKGRSRLRRGGCVLVQPMLLMRPVCTFLRQQWVEGYHVSFPVVMRLSIRRFGGTAWPPGRHCQLRVRLPPVHALPACSSPGVGLPSPP